MGDAAETTYGLLRCPDDGAEFEAQGEALQCAKCGRQVPVRGGIPRFVSDEHLESFGFQWNRYEVAHDDEDRATLTAKTGFNLSELKGQRILDAGSGGGRYCKVAAEAGANVFGADHTAAVEKAKSLCSELPQARFVQADLKRLPFAAGTFDAAFSIGVMHHDADTRAVFDAVAPMVKPGGKLAVWLYRRNQWWQEGINNLLRRRTTKMPHKRLERWSKVGAWLGGLPVVNKTLNKIVNFSSHPSRENRICDTFDWYAPRYQYHHTVDELCAWFREAGYGDLIVLPPEKTGRFYRWCYNRNLLIGSGVNVRGTRM